MADGEERQRTSSTNRARCMRQAWSGRHVWNRSVPSPSPSCIPVSLAERASPIGGGVAADPGPERPGPGQVGAEPPPHGGGLLRRHLPLEDHQCHQTLPRVSLWPDRQPLLSRYRLPGVAQTGRERQAFLDPGSKRGQQPILTAMRGPHWDRGGGRPMSVGSLTPGTLSASLRSVSFCK